MSIFYTLSLSTFRGFSPGAVHYYGRLHWYKNDKYEAEDVTITVTDPCYFCKGSKCEYCEQVGTVPRETSRLESEFAVEQAAIEWFKKHAKKGDVLGVGQFAAVSPKKVLAGLTATQTKKANKIWLDSENYGFKHGYHGKTYDAYYKAWQMMVPCAEKYE